MIIRCSPDGGFPSDIRWLKSRYTSLRGFQTAAQRLFSGCQIIVKPLPFRKEHHIFISHRNHIVMAVPTATTWSWPYPLQSHGHDRTHCNHMVMAVPTAARQSWPYPPQPDSHGRTHCNHMVMAVPTATTQPWSYMGIGWTANEHRMDSE